MASALQGYAFGGERAEALRAKLRDKLRSRKRQLRRDELAERLSEHGDVARAAREMGVSLSYGRVLFAEIRAGLGWQAK